MGEMATSGGGIHPGAPIIWPTLKPTSSSQSQSQQTQTTQTTEQSSTTSTAQSSSQAAATSQSSAVSQSATSSVTVTSSASPQVRELTVNDIKTHLLSLQLVDSETNVKLASLMLRFGIELSRENFVKALGMLEGTDKSLSTQESALVLLSKGITGSKEALTMLSSHLAETPAISSQLSSIKSAMNQLSGVLASNQALLSPVMVSQLAALLAQFSDVIEGLPKKYKFGSESTNSIGRDDLINDVRALKSLLDGVQEKNLSQENKTTSENEVLRSTMMTTAKKLEGLLDNLLSQVILSKKSADGQLGKQDYLYYQIPNSLADPVKTIDLIIKRDPNSKNAVNPEDTQMVIGLETENLGKMVIAVTLKDKSVKFLFNTEVEATKKLVDEQNILIKETLSDKGYHVENVSSRVNTSMCIIKPYLIPLLGLDHLFRIDSTI
ncbi:MAG: flagellar hook-length control protein FliK [Candidatus Saganbacteria bacterium]|nr:flagellar hook-length control protein FliK [Candidatus Saganbacteria bacterium]